MNTGKRNELWGQTLADELARSGVRHVVVSPGSRSTPLVLAFAANERFRVHVQIDERSAAFLGLGIGKATGRPAAMVTTSGTAVANLFPAVVEAAQAEVPLLLLTADRPPRLRGADANQTIQQVGIFGGYVRRFEEVAAAEVTDATLRHLRSVVARSVSAALGDPAGPVHLNVPFAKPLEAAPEEPVGGDVEDGPGQGRAGRSEGAPWTKVEPSRAGPAPEAVSEVAEALLRARRPLFVAGVLPRPGSTGAAIRRAAEALGVPLLADVLSGARFEAPTRGVGEPVEGSANGEAFTADGDGRREPTTVGGYDIALRDPAVAEALRPDLLIRFGAAPTSSVLNAWLSELDPTPHVLVDGGGRWKDHAGTATRFVPSDPGLFLEALVPTPTAPDPAWTASWKRVERAVVTGIGQRTRSPDFEGALVAHVAKRMAPDDVLFVSNSMPVRDMDAFVPQREGPLRVLGNRGASGIDGIISTAAGVALGSARRVVSILGDLAFLHDSNGLAALRESSARVLLVVLNNDGGGIFHMLPVRDREPPFTRLFATPHGRRLGLLAELHDLPCLRVDLRGGSDAGARGELEAAWAAASEWKGSGVLELRTDRDGNQRARARAIEEIAGHAGAVIT